MTALPKPVFNAVRRSTATELMDADDVDYPTFRGCLVDLARVNRLSLGYRPTIGFLDGLRRAGRLPKGRPLAILDAGSGYGDTLREIARWAERHRIAVSLVGVDRNPWSARAAAEATPPGAPIAWRTGDVFAFRPDGPVDLVISALFTHHLGGDALIRFVTWMEATAGLGWFINDLHRRRLAYSGFKAASRALRMHPFVQHDGPVSFARSFVAADWRSALDAAGVPADAAKIERWTPFRLCVARTHPT